jgi:2,3-dihydroxybenzoate decarboxylase
MTAIAPQDPEWSAAEIRRGAELGFRGVLVNSHTHGEYLDHPKFDPIFRALADTGHPLYIHPTTPPDSMIGPMLEAGLDGAVFGFGVETGLHLLRLITSASSIAIPISRSSSAMRARRCPTGSIA